MARGTFGLICLFSAVTEIFSAGECEDEWSHHDGSCYMKINVRTNAEAKQRCGELNAQLPSIHSAAENNFIGSLVNGGEAWIGLTDQAKEGTFVWDDGSDVDYTRWANDEPNNIPSGSDCVRIDNNRWKDITCSSSYYGVCKKCEENWTEHDGNCYKKIGSMARAAAASECEKAAAILSSIHSVGENNFVYDLAGERNHWIGLTDAVKEGTFAWDDGTPLDYTAWESWEPNDYPEGSDCARMDTLNWADTACSDSYVGVCKKKATLIAPTFINKWQKMGSNMRSTGEVHSQITLLVGERSAGRCAKLAFGHANVGHSVYNPNSGCTLYSGRYSAAATESSQGDEVWMRLEA